MEEIFCLLRLQWASLGIFVPRLPNSFGGSVYKSQLITNPAVTFIDSLEIDRFLVVQLSLRVLK